MKITNTKVYGLEESVRASHYPMSTGESLDYSNITDKDYERMRRLGSANTGSGHDNALKGIIVQMDVNAPQYFWPQFQRYHFADFVSSQSKMHSITRMDLDKRCNEHVDRRVIDIAKQYIADYKKSSTPDGFQRLLSNLPMGLELTARITTNYLQLKTIYSQRRMHPLEEWKVFCDWCEELPYFKEFTQKKAKHNKEHA